MNTELLKKLAQEIVKSQNSGSRTTSIVKVQRPEGTRFYKGIGTGASTNFRKSQSVFNAMLKSKNNPTDSTTTRQVQMFKGDKR